MQKLQGKRATELGTFLNDIEHLAESPEPSGTRRCYTAATPTQSGSAYSSKKIRGSAQRESNPYSVMLPRVHLSRKVVFCS